MSTTTKHLLSALATAAFAVAATATTVTNAFAQTEKKVEQPQGKTRAEVQAEYLEARKNGTLIETEADMDVAQTRKHIVKH